MPGRSVHSLALRGYGLFGGTGFDYDFDAVYQFGRSGPEQHRAFGFTGEIGYTFNHAWKPRVSAFYGYASGDRDPADRKDQRFERYFGFGRPWSANDYIDWSNISTPKARLEVQPSKNLRVDAGYSFYWLASDKDRWSNANLRDTRKATAATSSATSSTSAPATPFRQKSKPPWATRTLRPVISREIPESATTRTSYTSKYP